VCLVPAGRPAGQSASSFAQQIAALSEPGGYFDTDNLISNESSYLQVLPELRRRGVTGGVYIGVGPDQNFTYIADVRPALAFIVDIRRDNLLLHLLFKALFGLASGRSEYLSMLTGRAPPSPPEAWRDASLPRIVAYLDETKPLADLNGLRRRLQREIAGFNVPLTASDYTTIERFHSAFINAGLSLKFESRGRPARAVYPTSRLPVRTVARVAQPRRAGRRRSRGHSRACRNRRRDGPARRPLVRLLHLKC